MLVLKLFPIRNLLLHLVLLLAIDPLRLRGLLPIITLTDSGQFICWGLLGLDLFILDKTVTLL
jgi:hypothetical protein